MNALLGHMTVTPMLPVLILQAAGHVHAMLATQEQDKLALVNLLYFSLCACVKSSSHPSAVLL